MNLPNWTGLWCGDVWKSIVQLRSTFTDLNVFVLNCDFGIGVIARGKPQKMLNFSDAQIKVLTYEDLNQNRQSMLNLKPQEFLFEFLKTLT